MTNIEGRLRAALLDRLTVIFTVHKKRIIRTLRCTGRLKLMAKSRFGFARMLERAGRVAKLPFKPHPHI